MRNHRIVRGRTIVAMLLMCAWGASAAAQQRTLALNRGTFVFDSSTSVGTLQAAATGGLRLNAQMGLSEGSFAAIESCKNPECPPGAVVDLTAMWGGIGVSGTARIKGTTYEMGSATSDASVVLAFSGSVTMPPFTGGPVTVSTPFDFAGVFGYGLNGTDPQQVLLTGGGIATLTLVPQGENMGTWQIAQVVFEFRPPGRR